MPKAVIVGVTSGDIAEGEKLRGLGDKAAERPMSEAATVTMKSKQHFRVPRKQ